MRSLVLLSFFFGLCFSYSTAQQTENIGFSGMVPRISTSEELPDMHHFSIAGAGAFPQVISKLYLNGVLRSTVHYDNIKENARASQLLVTTQLHDSVLLSYIDAFGTLPPGRWKHEVLVQNERDTLWNERSYTLRNFEVLDSLLSFQHISVKHNRLFFSYTLTDSTIKASLQGKGLRQKDSIYSAPLQGRISFSIHQMGFVVCNESIEVIHLLKQPSFINSSLSAAGLPSGTGIEVTRKKLDLLKNPIITPSIGIETEVNMSDIDTLYGLLPANYYRVRLQPKLTVVGIPLQSDVYYTSESGFGYQMNSINLQLDREALEESLREKAKTQQRAYQQRMLELTYKERLAEAQKRGQEAALQKCVAAGERAQKELMDSLYQLENGFKERAEDSMASGSDSLSLAYQKRHDSLQLLMMEKREAYDALRDSFYEQAALAQKHYDDVVAQKAGLEKRISEIKALRNGGFQSPELLDSAAFINQTEKVLLAIDNLQVGRHYLQTDPSSFGGVPVDGLSFDYQHKWALLGFSVANFSPQNLFFDQNLASENTFRLKRASVGVGVTDKHVLQASLLHISHKEGAELNNAITSLQYYNAVHERFTVQMNLSLSEHYLAGSSAGIGTQSMADGNYRFTLETQADLYKEVVSASYFHSETGLNYTTVTSPFLRNDLRRQQLGLKLRPSPKVTFDLYRKTEASINATVSNFQMTGYGFSGSYTGNKGFLMTTSYMPFNYEVDIINYQKMARTRSDVLLLSVFQRFQKHTLGLQATQMSYSYGELERSGRYRNYALLWQSSALQNLSLQSQIGLNDLRQGKESQLSMAWNAQGTYDISGRINTTIHLSRQANLLTGALQSRAGIGLQFEFMGFVTGVEFGYLQMPVHFESTELQEGYYFNLGIRNSVF